MTTPPCKEVLFGSIVVAATLVLLMPFYPIAAISFEAGLVVGLLLHISHQQSAVERGHLDRKT